MPEYVEKQDTNCQTAIQHMDDMGDKSYLETSSEW
jgi:hypothetical protein